MFQNMNLNSAYAAGKHVASYIAGGISVAVLLHFITPGDASGLNDNLNTIYHGISEVVKGIMGIIAILTPIYTAWKSAHNASPIEQARSLQQAVPGTLIVTSPEIARATPENPSIVSNTEVKVTTKT